MATPTPYANSSGGGGGSQTPSSFTPKDKGVPRTGGSGFTVFTYNSIPIAWGQTVQHISPSFVGNGMSVIQPLDEAYPLHIMTPMAAGPGAITINFYELWGSNGKSSKIWDALGGGGMFNGAADIVDLAIMQAKQDPAKTVLSQVIRPLPGIYATNTTGYYQITYHNATITSVRDGETIQVGTLEVIKQITFNYTKATRSSSGNNLADNLFKQK